MVLYYHLFWSLIPARCCSGAWPKLMRQLVHALLGKDWKCCLLDGGRLLKDLVYLKIAVFVDDCGLIGPLYGDSSFFFFFFYWELNMETHVSLMMVRYRSLPPASPQNLLKLWPFLLEIEITVAKSVFICKDNFLNFSNLFGMVLKLLYWGLPLKTIYSL